MISSSRCSIRWVPHAGRPVSAPLTPEELAILESDPCAPLPTKLSQDEKSAASFVAYFKRKELQDLAAEDDRGITREHQEELETKVAAARRQPDTESSFLKDCLQIPGKIVILNTPGCTHNPILQICS